MNKIYLILCLAFLFSCTTDNMLNEVEEQNEILKIENNKNPINSSNKLLYSDIQKNIKTPFSAAERGVSGDNLDLCEDDYELLNIEENTLWGFGNNLPGYIDNELEKIFTYNWRFNVRMIKRGEPTFVNSGSVDFFESPTTDINGNDQYFYLSTPITVENANILKQDLACKMMDYLNTNNPGLFIYDVDIFGDVLLNGQKLFLRANFKIGY